MAELPIQEKIKRLEEVMSEKKSVLVAFSGGVDSTVVACIARRVLFDRSVAATIDSPTLPRRELAIARRVAAEIGIRHIIIASAGLDPELVRNSCDRCYFCKQGDLALLRDEAIAGGYEAIAYGVTTSDYSEHRPGLRALAESGSFLPLVEACIGKNEIRAIAKVLGLSNHDQPSTACLGSRIPYGQEITGKKLAQVEAAETFLLAAGLRQVRVRHTGDTARIEVPPADLDKLMAMRLDIVGTLKALGFTYVTVDWQGYRSGSMDEALRRSQP